MTKALHVFVYLFLILAGAALWFELQLNAKRKLLTDRNRMQEDFFVNIAATIEKDEPNKDVQAEIKLDVSPVEAKIYDTPDTENVLEEYKFYLEQANLPTFTWTQRDREQLRMVYVLDAEGNPVMDGDRPKMQGPGTEHELLTKLFEACKNQQTKLNNTRAELVVLHEKLEKIVDELNALKPVARQDKVTIVEKTEKIAKLEGEKAELENTIVKLKAQIEELNTEVTSLKDEVVTAHDEADALKEDLAKEKKNVETLKKLVAEMIAAQGTKSNRGTIINLPAGEKGKIIEADNENMFAIVQMTPEAMKQLKGNDLNQPLPMLELGVKRPGFQGQAGEFVGRVRLRQEVAGKNYIVCDILSAWEQSKLSANDVLFAD